MKLVGWRLAVLGAALAAGSATCANGTSAGPTSSGAPDGGTSDSGPGDGATGGCTSASDCPVPNHTCLAATCNAGACGTENAPKGTVVMKDVPADCHSTVCDGAGGIEKAVDPTNTPTSNDPCIVGACDMTGAPGTAPAPAGTACTSSSGGKLCDGAGQCVECLHDADCPPGHTCGVLNACMGSHCMDGVLDGDETDVDCGGSTCPPCAADKMCKVGSDCMSGACDPVMHTCLSPMCSDGVKDGNETDVDCGGSCSACALGKTCVTDQDCTSQACDAVSLTCVADQCMDHQKDGAETDVDCGGGTCPPCANGKACVTGADCMTGNCDLSSHTCKVDQCHDGVKDGSETDIDCGGGICAACALGKTCQLDSDCLSQACDALTHTCVADQCMDHRQDGMETDVDCGGSACAARCGLDQKCLTTSDCVAGLTCFTGTPHVCM